MYRGFAIALLLTLGAAAPLSAQTPIAGSLQCSSPRVEGVVEVGDRDGHKMLVSQTQCRWSPPLRIAGVDASRSTLSLFTDMRADRSRDTGYDTIVMSNGDKIFLHYAGFRNPGAKPPASGDGSFAFSGGTGKFLGIYGSGTLRTQTLANGEVTVLLDGHYTLPGF